jgi:hypothetical protein
MSETPATPTVADYYQCTGGLTIGMTVCQDGEVIEGSAMGFSETNPPLSEEDQEKVYGQVMYKEYTPDEEELVAIQQESSKIRALSGMQSPGEPKVVLTSGIAEPPLESLSRQELRALAKKVGLNFPADTDRDQMIGAIAKKQKEEAEATTEQAASEAPPEEEEVPTNP